MQSTYVWNTSTALAFVTSDGCNKLFRKTKVTEAQHRETEGTSYFKGTMQDKKTVKQRFLRMTKQAQTLVIDLT